MKKYNAPFDVNNDASRQKYIIDRITGVAVPPAIACSHGENSYDILVDWIENENVPWSKNIKEDLPHLLVGALMNYDICSFELAGLLACETALRDDLAGKIVTNFLMKKELNIEMLFLDTPYGTAGNLMFRLIDITNQPKAVKIFTKYLNVVPTSEAVVLLTYILKRQVIPIVNRCIQEKDNDSLKFLNDVINEIVEVKNL